MITVYENEKVNDGYRHLHAVVDDIGSMNIKISKKDKNDYQISNIVGDELKLRWACSDFFQ